MHEGWKRVTDTRCIIRSPALTIHLRYVQVSVVLASTPTTDWRAQRRKCGLPRFTTKHRQRGRYSDWEDASPR